MFSVVKLNGKDKSTQHYIKEESLLLTIIMIYIYIKTYPPPI